MCRVPLGRLLGGRGRRSRRGGCLCICSCVVKVRVRESRGVSMNARRWGRAPLVWRRLRYTRGRRERRLRVGVRARPARPGLTPVGYCKRSRTGHKYITYKREKTARDTATAKTFSEVRKRDFRIRFRKDSYMVSKRKSTNGNPWHNPSPVRSRIGIFLIRSRSRRAGNAHHRHAHTSVLHVG